MLQTHAYQIHSGTLRPKSRGTIKLRSNNPRDKPIIQPNYLENHDDLIDLCDSVRLTVEIMNAKALSKYKKRFINIDESILNDQNKLE